MIFKINKLRFFSSVLFLIFTLLVIGQAQAQTTAFNFQGRLNDGGNAANGRYDLQFKLFDALAGGNQVASTINRANTQVINGVFSTVLDFGSAFTAGNRFLEISVRPNGSSNAHVILGARQQILAVPFAAHSATSTDATNSLSLGGVSANNYARLNFANQGDVVGANIGSNGYISVAGNTLQPAASYGFAKALILVAANASVLNCYNGVTGSSANSCGFTVTAPLGEVGVYRINFGFPVSNRFVTATGRFVSDNPSFNAFPLIRTINDTTLEVFMMRQNSPGDTVAATFNIVVF